jgi:arylsulfatase A-like enzyme
VPAGKVCHQLASGLDLLPSLATIAGAKFDPGQIDGLDLSPLFLGKMEAPLRNEFYYYDAGRLAAVRDTRWKLHLRGPDEEPRKLYDLESDPGETKDVTSLHPDVVARLSALGEAAARRFGNGSQKGEVERPEGKASRLMPITRALPMMRGESGEGEAPKAEAAEPAAPASTEVSSQNAPLIKPMR